MLYKSFDDFEVKAASDNSGQAVITGYASKFGEIDQAGDVVVKGAFEKSINSGKKVLMLYQHDRKQVIGRWTELVEDDVGLRVSGILSSKGLGAEVAELISLKAIDGLSIGYRVLDSQRAGNITYLKDIQLGEISVVSFPCLESAVIDQKAVQDMSINELHKHLVDSGLSNSVAKKLLSGGYGALKQNHQIDEEKAKSEIIELLNKNINLLKTI